MTFNVRRTTRSGIRLQNLIPINMEGFNVYFWISSIIISIVSPELVYHHLNAPTPIKGQFGEIAHN